jgi:hypothetical protein
MPRISPTLEGFRATFRLPSLMFAEITWRWTVGATALALLLFGTVEYLRTLPVSSAELLLLRSRQPILVGQAIARILRGSLDRAALAAVLGVIALTCLWMVAASLGRIVTVRAMLEYFAMRRDGAGTMSSALAPDNESRDDASRVSMRPAVAHSHTFSSVLGINFLRAALLVAAIFGFEGASILADLTSPPASPQPGLAFILFFALAALVGLAWYCLNWYLSLAAVFAVRDGEDTMGALSSAATFSCERIGPLFGVSFWTGLAHFVAFIGATIAVSLPLGLIAALPVRLVLACMTLVTLMYFAVADWLHAVRLAGYVCILEMPEAKPALSPLSPASTSGGQLASRTPVEITIDRDEPILSDLPLIIPAPQEM